MSFPDESSVHSEQPQKLQLQHQPQQTSQRSRKNLSVCISEPVSIQVYSIERVQDVSPSSDVWFTQEEINATIRECAETVNHMKRGITLGSDTTHDQAPEFTCRGLEYCTPDGFDITTSSLDVVHLILEEQERQKVEGIVDTQMLAAAVGGISRHRHRIAHLAAMKDVRGVYGNDRLMTTAEDEGKTGPTRCNSFSGVRRERRGRNVRRSGSFGNLEEKVRRRRGSRGPLGEKKTEQRRFRSDPGPESKVNREA